MGGPEDQNQKFIIKFNEQIKIVDNCALDPMPDFAYRQDHWTAAPITTDSQGATAYNVMALSEGYPVKVETASAMLRQNYGSKKQRFSLHH